jgi:hypothetical protein
MDIRLLVGGRELTAEWTDHGPTPGPPSRPLPIAGRASRWGDELYVDLT